jgi:HSP20 family molecular chaperone IbpA
VTINAELTDEAQKFSRSITLPEAVDDEASEARFTDGALYLTLKKKSVSQSKRLTIH